MIKEELTKLLMEAYERGQSDIIKSCHETVAIAVDTAILAEREACIQIVENEAFQYASPVWAFEIVNDIKARGQA